MAMVKGTDDPKLRAEIKQLSRDKELLETVVATGALGGGSASSELQDLILGRLKKRALEEQEQENAELERRKKRLLTEAQEAEKRNNSIRWQQQHCSHLDGLNQRRTGGQWNSDGKYAIFCLACFKKFSNAPGGEPCPPHLMPEEMGGAVMEAINRVGYREPANVGL